MSLSESCSNWLRIPRKINHNPTEPKGARAKRLEGLCVGPLLAHAAHAGLGHVASHAAYPGRIAGPVLRLTVARKIGMWKHPEGPQKDPLAYIARE